MTLILKPSNVFQDSYELAKRKVHNCTTLHKRCSYDYGMLAKVA